MSGPNSVGSLDPDFNSISDSGKQKKMNFMFKELDVGFEA
jgi:hypothetical protein